SAPAVEAIIAPHIDFHRGGPAYAWAYRDLAERCAADLFVIVGTCHVGMRHPFALTRKDYDTPLAPARADRDFVEALAARAALDARVGDRRPIAKAERALIEAEDLKMLETVERGDAEACFDSVAADGDRRRICGLSPIYAGLHALDGRCGALKRYGMWPDPEGIVSYASVVFDGSAS